MRIFTSFVLILHLLGVVCSQRLSAQCNSATNNDLYWRGGSGNFNDETKWDVGFFGSGVAPCQKPGSDNNVFFMDAAFPSAGANVLINADAACKNMVWDNAIVNTPTLSGANSNLILDIYGEVFELAPNMNFAYNGTLRFVCPTAGLLTVRTLGKILSLKQCEIGIGAGTELRLLDDLKIDNIGTEGTGALFLYSGYFNTNAKRLDVDVFRTMNSDVSRRINWDNSRIIIEGRGNNYREFEINFTATNSSGFSAVGSHIMFTRPASAGIWNGINVQSFFGSMSYDSITFANAKTGITGVQTYPQTMSCNYFAVAGGNTIDIRGSSFNTNICVLGANTVLNFNGSAGLIMDVLVPPTGCQAAFLINVANSTATIRKKTVGNLVLSNCVFNTITGDITGGRTYTANNSIATNSTNINVTAPTACVSPLYFRDNTNDQDWQTLNNWRDASNNPVTELPSLFTDVIFDGASFPNTNKFVNIQADAAAKSMTWTGTPNNAEIRLGTRLYIAESLTLPANMKPINADWGPGFGINFMTTGTLQTAGKTGNTGLHFMRGSDYTVLDTTSCGIFNVAVGGMTRATNVSIRTTSGYTAAKRILDNVRFYFTDGTGGWTAFSETDVTSTTYLNNTTFFFSGNNPQYVRGLMPNVVVNTFANPSNAFKITALATIQGNLIFNSPCNYIANGGVTQISVTGDVNIAPGMAVVKSSAAGSYLRIGGNLNMLGTCTQPITLQTNDGVLAEVRVLGTANIQNAVLNGINSTNPMTAVNSINGGNNSANISFTGAPGTTYYWRANRLTPTVFAGNWSNADHWTTNPANLVGDGACIPRAVDNVVFDNLSYSGTSNGCTQTGTVYCKDFTVSAGARIIASTAVNFYINGNFSIVAATVWNCNASIYFVGAGNFNIQTAGKIFALQALTFNNAASTWTLQNTLSLSNAADGQVFLIAGTLNANNNNITIANRFISNNTNTRALILGTATLSFLQNGGGGWRGWSSSPSTNLTVSGGTIIFEDGTIIPGNLNFTGAYKQLSAGTLDLSTTTIIVNDLDETFQLYGNAKYGYVNLNASAYIDGNNSFDSLGLNGGYAYRFRSTTTQTLNAPHGKIKALGVNGSSYINMESSIPNSVAFIRKAYGEAFCVDYVKVKDVRAIKETNLALVPTTPVNYQVLHPFLEFQTGINSDSISIQADNWGIWAFNLPILILPTFSGANTHMLCKIGANQSFPLSFVGSSPYFVNYTWSDNLSNSGSNSFLVSDDDSDPNTPFVYQMALPNTAGSTFNYNLNLKTTRCGEYTVPHLNTRTVTMPSANTLVAVNRSGACDFNNEPDWYTLVDNVQQRLMVSLQDKVNAADASALGNVSTDVYFDASVQTYNYLGINYPYLQRHWTISPANNGQANVRLYFTQAELNALSQSTFAGAYAGGLNPATDLRIFKFSGNAVGVGAMTIISPTLVPITGTVATPFSSTANVYCLEFSVSSFSHFIVVPTTTALLPLELLSFDAKSQDQKTVDVSWSVNADNQTISYEVQRSANAVDAQTVANVPATASQNYSLNDAQPLSGVSYYRIKELKRDGTFAFSDWKSVEIRRMQIMEVFPVPAKDQLNIRVRTYNSSRLNTRIYDNFGRLVAQQSHTVQPETMELLNLNTDRLANGIYTLQCVDAQGVASSQVFEISR